MSLHAHKASNGDTARTQNVVLKLPKHCLLKLNSTTIIFFEDATFTQREKMFAEQDKMNAEQKYLQLV